MALICATVTAATTADLRRQRDTVADADMIELRLDTVSDPDAAGALAGRRLPVIVTCRSAAEGGHFKGSEEERKRILLEAVALGADYVDVEMQAGFADVIRQRGGQGVIVSLHDFGGIPVDLSSRISAMRATGAQVVKVAVTPRRLSDCNTLLAIDRQSGHQNGLVVLGLGPFGSTTRILPDRFGSAWTYAGALHDIGQLSVKALVNSYNFRSVDAATEIYGIVGGSVAHSVSPAMHNAAFRALQFNAAYVPLPAVDAVDFVEFGKAFKISGASVTMPHKVTLFDRLDEVYSVARRIGAINTVRVEHGRWIGGNTDAAGFLEPLRERISVRGLQASILGAGGAARAVAVGLASAGCSIRVHARDTAKATQVAMQTASEVGPWPPKPGSWDLLVNCTPIGMYPRANDTPIDREQLTGRFVYDIVYNPTQTRLMREAAEMGCETIGGLDMLVAQAQEQFHWWTGLRAPAGLMREAALKRLAEFSRNENHVV
jgi:shikimate dehydrogenase/3-dehydroquinate dehydratase type I